MIFLPIFFRVISLAQCKSYTSVIPFIYVNKAWGRKWHSELHSVEIEQFWFVVKHIWNVYIPWDVGNEPALVYLMTKYRPRGKWLPKHRMVCLHTYISTILRSKYYRYHHDPAICVLTFVPHSTEPMYYVFTSWYMSFTLLFNSLLMTNKLNMLTVHIAYVFERKHKHVFTFDVIPPHWHDADSLIPYSCKPRTYLIYIVNIMAADDLATPGTRASPTMILTVLNQIISVPDI